MFEEPNDANKIITSFMNDQEIAASFKRNNECLIGKANFSNAWSMATLA